MTGTYSTHAWRLRDTETSELLAEYVGGDATIELLGATSDTVVVHKGFRTDIVPPLARPVPADWGLYRRRGVALGMPIMVRACSETCTSDAAKGHAVIVTIQG